MRRSNVVLPFSAMAASQGPSHYFHHWLAVASEFAPSGDPFGASSPGPGLGWYEQQWKATAWGGRGGGIRIA